MRRTATDTAAPLLYDHAEVLDLLGVHRATLHRLRRERRFPAPVRIDGRLRWRAADVARWVESRPRDLATTAPALTKEQT